MPREMQKPQAALNFVGMISTHVLDTSLGTPAADVDVVLERLEGTAWRPLANEKTNTDGRIAFKLASEPGRYRLVFQIETYFQRCKVAGFFTSAPVEFRIDDVSRKYHVPLLLNPFGYSTYRGS